MSKRKVSILPPEKFENLILKKQKNVAAGIPAVLSTFKIISEEVGIVKGMRVLNKMNQKNGFDCPGCAWPDSDDNRSVLGEYCENGAKSIAEEATFKKISSEFFKNNSVEFLSEQTDYWIGKLGRLTQPMYLAKDSSYYEPISWADAYKKIAKHLNSLESPNEATFYTSGRTSNEAAFLYQLFVREFGTNNLPDCSNMCHESSGAGLSNTVGIGKGSVTLKDLHKAEVIIVMGQNPGTNHPRMLGALEECKKNGGKIVTINPLQEAGTTKFIDPQNPFSILKGGVQLEDLFLQVKINGDLALLKAVMVLMFQAEEKNPNSVFDHEFIKDNCENYELLVGNIKSSNYYELVEQTGVDEQKIKDFAELLINNKKIIICWAMGITQQQNGVATIQEIVNVLLLKGSIGIEGGGTCPVRGHSNVQGDRTMGIWEKPKDAFLDQLEKRFNFTAPRKHGVDVVTAIQQMADKKIKVFIGLGGNFVSATPDSQFTGEAIQNCDLTVQISTKLNRAHLITGKEAIILPCKTRSEIDIQNGTEQFVTVENSMGVVHMSKGVLKPSSKNIKSEAEIVAELASISLRDSKTNWSEMIADYDLIRNHIEATINGFEDYNKRVRKLGGFYLPNGSRSREFNTPNKKAKFTSNTVPNRQVAKGNFIMMTLRTHDQYNTTIYGMNDRYRGVYNERRVVLMNEKDMNKYDFEKEQVVNLTSHFKGETRHAKNFKIIPYNIPIGCVGTYFPETNALVHLNNVAKISNTPASKFIEVSIEKM